MFLPVGIEHTIKRLPPVTLAIIAICTLVQIYSAAFAPSTEDLMREAIERVEDAHLDENDPHFEEQVRAIAEEVGNKNPIIHYGYPTGSGVTYKAITSSFVHGGWWHLIGNMLFLWLCGAALEDRWGSVKFALFYFGGAIVSTLGFDLLYSGEETRLVGASGAISALMGAFLVFFAKTQVRIAYLWYFRFGTFLVAAYYALPFWFAEQLFYNWLKGAMPGMSNVAYEAHISGFAAGCGAALVMKVLEPREEPVPRAEVVSAKVDPERMEKLMAAIRDRRMADVRGLASRVILDLAGAKDHSRVIDVYDALARLGSMPLTDGAFAATALAAESFNDPTRYVAIANAFESAHPGSAALPKVLWRLAQLHRDAGRDELATSTLRTLAQRFARDPYGQQAAALLDRQSLPSDEPGMLK